MKTLQKKHPLCKHPEAGHRPSLHSRPPRWWWTWIFTGLLTTAGLTGDVVIKLHVVPKTGAAEHRSD